MSKEEQSAAAVLAQAIVDFTEKAGLGVEMAEHLGAEGLHELIKLSDQAK